MRAKQNRFATRSGRPQGPRTTRGLACVLAIVLSALGCATTGSDSLDEFPAHPFPRWVADLDTGQTKITLVREIFGEPAEVEHPPRGGVRWRYAYAEVRWEADDPDRPAVASDGRPIEPEPTWVDHGRATLAKTGHFLEGLLFYPARRSTPPRGRMMPATIHDLELHFDADGVLQYSRYTPRPGRTRVAPDGG